MSTNILRVGQKTPLYYTNYYQYSQLHFRLKLGFQNSHGISSCRWESIDSSLWQMCISISGRFARVPERCHAPCSLRRRRFLVTLPSYPAFVLLRPRTTLLRRRHRRRPAGTRSAKQGVSQGEHLEGNPPRGRHHPRQVVATCCCGTPRTYV